MAQSEACEAQKALLAKIVMVGESEVGKTSILGRYTGLCPLSRSLPASYIATIGIDFKVKTISLNDRTMRLQIWDTAGQERFHTFTTSFFRGAHGFVLVYDITNAESFQGIKHWMQDIHEKADENVEVILLGNKCDKESERVIPKNSGEKVSIMSLEKLEKLFSKETYAVKQLKAIMMNIHKGAVLRVNSVLYSVIAPPKLLFVQRGKLLLAPVLPFGTNIMFKGEISVGTVTQREKLAWEYGIPFFETSAKDNINIEDAFSVLAKEILNKSSYVLLDVDVVDLNAETKKKTCCKL